MTTTNSPIRRTVTLGAGVAAVAAVGAGAARFGSARAIRRWSDRTPAFPLSEFDLAATFVDVATSDGGSVACWVAGAGPTFVLGHGVAGDHTHWGPIAHRLIAAGHRVVTFDQRGHGQSTAGRAGFGLEGLAIDVGAVVEHFSTGERIVLAGHSMGGIGIQALVRHAPSTFDRVDAVVLVSTLATDPGIPLGKALATARGLRAYRSMLARPTVARVLMRTGFGTPAPPLVWIDRLAADWAACPEKTLLALGPALTSFDLRADTARFPVPVSVICGDHDRTTPLRLSREIAALVPRSSLTVVPGAGHMIVWERPDEVAAELRAVAGRAASSLSR